MSIASLCRGESFRPRFRARWAKGEARVGNVICCVDGGEDSGDDGKIGAGFAFALSRGGVDVRSWEGNEGGKNDCDWTFSE